MIPHTYPTFVDARKQGYMRVFFLTSVTGLTKWVDYIPVKTVAFSAANEGTTNANGHMTVMQVASSTALAAWRDYVPVFEDGSATVAWGSGSNGYIPVCQALNLDFTAPILDSRITFTRADATSCATYFDSTGRLQTAAANVARFDYDPSTVAGVTGGELATSSTVQLTGSTGFVVTATMTTGKTYLVSYTYNLTSGSIQVGGAMSPAGAVQTGPTSGTYSIYTQNAVASSNIIFSNAAVGTITNLSIKECVFSPRGLLMEESRTNLLLRSRDMTNAAWTKTDVTPTRNQVGIDGTANSACLMTEGSAGTAGTSQTGASVTAGSTITGTFVFKRGNTDWVSVSVGDSTLTNGAGAYFNLNTGAKGTVAAFGTGTGASSSITSLGGGWYRVAVTVTPSGAYTLPAIYMRSASADNSGTRVSGATYIVDAAQLEVGSFATSPIITTAATVTRAVDSASMTGSNFSSWWNASAGTFVTEYVTGNHSNLPSVLSLGAVASNSGISLSNTTSPSAEQCWNGSTALPTLNSVAVGVLRKSAFAFGTGRSICLNGGTVASDAGASYAGTPAAAYLGVTQAGSQNINGWIRRITYYPKRLTDAQLQSLTT